MRVKINVVPVHSRVKLTCLMTVSILAYVPNCWVTVPTFGEYCFAMIGIDESFKPAAGGSVCPPRRGRIIKERRATSAAHLGSAASRGGSSGFIRPNLSAGHIRASLATARPPTRTARGGDKRSPQRFLRYTFGPSPYASIQSFIVQFAGVGLPGLLVTFVQAGRRRERVSTAARSDFKERRATSQRSTRALNFGPAPHAAGPMVCRERLAPVFHCHTRLRLVRRGEDCPVF